MPDGILPDEGITQILDCIVRLSVSGVPNWYLILWTNDFTPDESTVLADLTEATFGGYSRVELVRSTWTAAVIDHPGCAKSTWGTDAVVWLVTGGPSETIYGFAYIDAIAGVIRAVQRFDPGDIVTVNPGDRVALLPPFTLTSAACP